MYAIRSYYAGTVTATPMSSKVTFALGILFSPGSGQFGHVDFSGLDAAGQMAGQLFAELARNNFV